MPFAQVNDISMYYELHGKGAPIVLVEGFASNHQTWEEYVEPLAKHFQVLVFDNRGCGQTDAPEGAYSIEMLSKDAASLMDALKIKRAHMIGHSMGGSIIQQICFDYPEKIHKGILLAAFPKISKRTMLQMDVQGQLFGDGASAEALILNSFPWLYSNEYLQNRENIKKSLRKVMNNPHHQTLTGYLSQAEALRNFDSSSYLTSIASPILIVSGGDDPLTPLEECGIPLSTKIPKAKLHVFENQSHLFIEEKPQETLDLILRFLKE